MPSIATRVKRFLSPAPDTVQLHNTKSAYTNLFGSGAHQSYFAASTNQDYRADEYGFAQASQLLVDISGAINYWEQWLDGLVWVIRDKNGNELVRTDARQYDTSAPGARVFYALQRYRHNFKHSYWKSIVVSDFVAGETFIHFVGRGQQITDLQWLNPLYTEPYELNGSIQYYQYNNDDMQEVGYQIPVNLMAYRMMRRNIFDDLRGYSSILSVIDESNLSRNVKRAFRKFFTNGMILGGVIAPDGETGWTDRERKQVESDLIRNNSGMANAHNWIISPKKVLAQAFTQADQAQNLDALNVLSQYLATAIGVPRVLYGDPADATYENFEASERNWYKSRGIPYARDVATYHNNQILPRLEAGGVYIEPDVSKFETEKPEVVAQDVTSGYISIGTAQKKRGYDVDDDLNTIYLIGNRPMTKEVLIKLASTMPSEEIEQRASAEESLATAETKPLEAQADIANAETPLAENEGEDAKALKQESDGEPAFAYIPLANNRDIIVAQRELKRLFTDPRVEWQAAPTLHITLCYAQVADDSAIEKMVSLIDLEATDIQTVHDDAIGYYDTPDGKALHVKLASNSVLDAIQSDVYSAFSTETHDLSEYSQPDNWNPHITLAYLPDEYEPDTKLLSNLFSWLDGVTFSVNEVIIGRDDYDPVVIIKAPEYKKSATIAHGDHEHRVPVEAKAHSHEDCINELKAWKKFHKNDSSRNFIPDALRGDVADSLRLAIDSEADTEAAFDSAFETVRHWQKDIQATRLSFEDDFEDLLERARDEGNNFGRQQWASAVRSIIRRYGRQAYTDGLVAGGVLDGELSEEDENSVADIYAEQSQYVTNLGAQIFRTDEGVSTELANQKPAMWYRKSIAPFFDSGRESANANGMYEFGGPDGRESCSTCIRLKGQRHRLKTWARKALRPGVDTDNFECGGWQCEHKLIAVTAKARGNF